MPSDRDALVSAVASAYSRWLSTPTDRDSRALAATYKAEYYAAREALRTFDAEAEIARDFLHDNETTE